MGAGLREANMSIAANKELVRRFYEEVVSTGDTSGIADFVGPDCIEVDGERSIESGITGMTEHIQGVRSVYSDLRIAVDRQIAEGDWVVSQITASGTHTGEWIGIKPTGKVLRFTGVNVDRVVGGRIVEHAGAANMLEPLLTVGALRVVGD